jgi:hypothetical protein
MPVPTWCSTASAAPAEARWLRDAPAAEWQLNAARIKTCVRSPLLRFLVVALALLRRNVWVWFHWEVLASPRRGRRRLNLHRLRFKTLLHWLLQVAVADLGSRGETMTERQYQT